MFLRELKAGEETVEGHWNKRQGWYKALGTVQGYSLGPSSLVSSIQKRWCCPSHGVGFRFAVLGKHLFWGCQGKGEKNQKKERETLPGGCSFDTCNEVCQMSDPSPNFFFPLMPVWVEPSVLWNKRTESWLIHPGSNLNFSSLLWNEISCSSLHVFGTMCPILKAWGALLQPKGKQGCCLTWL